jgi:hypothetical protein
MASKLDRFTKSDGVVAIYATEVGTSNILTSGPPEHTDVLVAACQMLDVPVPGATEPCPSLRVELIQRHLVVERVGGWVVAVLTVTGHPIGKSLGRMIWKAFGTPTPTKPAPVRKVKPRSRGNTIMTKPPRQTTSADYRATAVRAPSDEETDEPRGIDFVPTPAVDPLGKFSPKRRLITRDEHETA